MDNKKMKVISWIALIVLTVACFFLLQNYLKEEVIKSESDEGLWVFFYISALIAFILSLVIMYQLTEEAEWNPFGAALTSAVAFPIITGLIAVAIAVLILIGVIALIVKIASSGESEKKFRKVGEGEYEVWREE